MAAPSALGVAGSAADGNYLAGALVVTFSVIAFGEIARPSRLLNIPLGLGLAVGPWWFGAAGAFCWSNTIGGLALAALSIRRGRIAARFAGWNRVLI
jgi:hypothetical protein